MIMNRKSVFTLFGLMLALIILPGYAFAGTQPVNSFVDQTTEPINLPATKLLVATVNTGKNQGGNDATSTVVNITGTGLLPADVAEVCVDYAAVEVACQTNPVSLSNISITLGGTEKGGDAYDYRITLNSSAGGKTIQVTVQSIAGTIPGTISLPQSTALRNIQGASTPPSIDTPTFSSVTATSAILGGRVVSVGTSPAADAQGTVYNYTGGLPTENAIAEGSTPADTTAFTHLSGGMNSADEVFFRAYVEQSATKYYSAVDSFFTYPANDPTGFSIDQVTSNSMRINLSLIHI